MAAAVLEASELTIMKDQLHIAALAFPFVMLPLRSYSASVLAGGTESFPSPLGYAPGYVHAFDFTSTTKQQLIALGYWDLGSDGLFTSWTVGLWNTSTQELLASAAISSSSILDESLTAEGGQWRYETLSTPITLSSGTSYTLGFYNPYGMPADESLLLSYSSVTTAPTITIMNERRFVGGGGLAFPTSTLVADDFYIGQVNALIVPEPEAAVLMVIGILLLLRRRRKFQNTGA